MFTYHPFVESQINYHQNYQFKIIITYKNTNIHLKNPFFLKEKTIEQTLNTFTIIKSITIIFKFTADLRSTKYNNKSSCICLTAKKKTLLFFTKHSVCLTAKENTSCFSLPSYTLIIFLEDLTSFFGTLQHKTKLHNFSLICVLYKKSCWQNSNIVVSPCVTS